MEHADDAGFPGGSMLRHVLTQYEHHVARRLWEGEFECAARTYLLHLVGSTIFSDKTHTHVEAKYINLLIDLDRCRYYSWDAATLVFLYDNMGDGAVHDTRQLGGYMTLLHCWIYEHFARICKRGDRGAVPAHLPRACRWIAKHAVEGGLVTYRQRLDALLLEDVVFTPYDDDRANHPFEDILMFSGYLRCGGVSVPYLLERCLRQFGRMQLYHVASFPGEVTKDYYPWYMSVSHPLIIPRSTAHAGTSYDHPSDHPSSAAHVGPSSAAHAGPSSSDRDRRVAELVRRAINLVEPFSEIHEILSELSLLYDD
uniref:Protein MAIN-LIKE 2-like n=1 Tax=Cicer arietinum TaxID=3827 RepID=A0A1S2YUC4_CICAR|nr:protein MAIN-LIKE 2-like [Cicer arietinum]